MSLYEVLGIEATATTEEIVRAGKDMARKHHPDKGGDPEMFKKTRHAVEVLTDPERKAMYDQTGSEDESGGGPDLASMFASMGFGFGGGGGGGNPFGFGGFGGFGGGGGPGPKRKGPNKDYESVVTLADFYHGKTISITFNQHKFCGTCKGHGGTSGEQCRGCKGAGQVMEVRQIAPGMIAQSAAICKPCGGKGKIVKGVCSGCAGKKLIEKKKNLEVSITPGMAERDITYREECSDIEGVDIAGDVVIHLRQKPDPIYTRVGADLHAKHTVTLAEALLGFRIELEHPRGTPFPIEHSEPVQHGQVIKVDGGGMPSGTGKGKLILTISIQMPTELTAAQKALVEGAFGKGTA